MSVEADQTPQEQIKQGIWRIALQTVVILVCIVFGVFIGYELWGDAPQLKIKIGALGEQVQTLKNEREGQNARQAMCERDKADFKQRLDKTFDKNTELQKQLKAMQGQ
jgi:hypothetical protein